MVLSRSAPPDRHPRARPLVGRPWPVIAAALLACLISGCGLIYQNRSSGRGFVVYSHRNSQFVSGVGDEVQLITDGFCKIFDIARGDLGFMTIILHGRDSNVLDYGHSPDLLGYYVPVINYISVDTNPVWAESDGLIGQVLLHEIAHHMIISMCSRASSECWLNEGLAGALEMSLYQDEHFECPLFNPVLFHVASRTAHAARKPLDLHDLVHKSWSEFHSESDKETNYALAWSAVYFILEHHFNSEEPLARRIRRLFDMEPEKLGELGERWNLFLRSFDDTEYFVRMATGGEELTSNWAISQLATSLAGDNRGALRHLASFFTLDHPEKRHLAYQAFLTRLEHTPFSFFIDEAWVRRKLAHIKNALSSDTDPPELRIQLIRCLAQSIVYRIDWIPVLIAMLDSPDAAVRVAALETLTQIASKSTIINPEFWRSAPAEKRAVEVADWRRWWANERRTAVRTL